MGKSWEVSREVNIRLLYDPVIPFLCIYLGEMKTHVNTNTCAHMFIEALFVIAIKWNTTQ